MVRRVATVVPQLLEPLIFQPLMSMDAPALLYNSMNSSLPPSEPRVRTSLMTTELEGGCVAVGVSVFVGVSVGQVGHGVLVGVVVEEGVRVVVGVLGMGVFVGVLVISPQLYGRN